MKKLNLSTVISINSNINLIKELLTDLKQTNSRLKTNLVISHHRVKFLSKSVSIVQKEDLVPNIFSIIPRRAHLTLTIIYLRQINRSNSHLYSIKQLFVIVKCQMNKNKELWELDLRNQLTNL